MSATAEQMAALRSFDAVLKSHRPDFAGMLDRGVRVNKPSAVEDWSLADATDGPPGTITGYLSTFNDIDLVGDRVMPGAFRDSIKYLKDAGIRIPLMYDHGDDGKGRGFQNPRMVIGVIDELREDRKGLWFKGRLDLDNEVARDLHRLMLIDPSVVRCSFAYDQLEAVKAKDKAMNLTRLHILEGTLTFQPANPLAGVTSIKTAGMPTNVQRLAVELDTHMAIAQRGHYDAVKAWDALLYRMVREGKTSTSLADVAATRCRCGRYITSKVQPPVTGGSVSWQACESCGAIRSFIPDGMTGKAADREHRNIRSKVYTVPVNDTRAADAAHNAKMLAHLKKVQQKREVRDLVSFATAPARPARADQRRDIAALQEFVKTTVKKSTTTDITSLFGDAAPIPLEKLR